MPGIRVLIVDDHTLFRQGLRSLLEADGTIEVVDEADNGVEAIAKARQLQPDVVLMDIAMSNVGGLQATRRIRKLAPSVKVLALSMHETEQYVQEMLRVGASGYISKRSPAAELLSAIQAVHKGYAYLNPPVAKKVLNGYVKRIKTDNREGKGERLTARELEVLGLIAEGRTNKEIAELLSLSVSTIQSHRLNLMRKLKAHDRTELVRYAIREGLITA